MLNTIETRFELSEDIYNYLKSQKEKTRVPMIVQIESLIRKQMEGGYS